MSRRPAAWQLSPNAVLAVLEGVRELSGPWSPQERERAAARLLSTLYGPVRPPRPEPTH